MRLVKNMYKNTRVKQMQNVESILQNTEEINAKCRQRKQDQKDEINTKHRKLAHKQNNEINNKSTHFVLCHRMQLSPAVASNGMQKNTLVHIRLEKDPCNNTIKHSSKGSSYVVAHLNQMLAERAAGFMKES